MKTQTACTIILVLLGTVIDSTYGTDQEPLQAVSLEIEKSSSRVLILIAVLLFELSFLYLLLSIVLLMRLGPSVVHARRNFRRSRIPIYVGSGEG